MAVALTSVTVAVMGLAACKSSGSGHSTSSSSARSGSTTAAKGPIRLLVDTPITGGAATGGISFPGGANGAKAAAADLNKTGGINGHKVEIDVCDNKTDPNAGPACARTAKSNGDVAVVGSFDPVSATAVLSILQKEGIPYVGALPASPAELSNPISFQFDGGANIGGFATISQMKSQGCKHSVEFSPGGPSAATDPLLKTEYGKAGIKYEKVDAPPTTPDVAPLISQALAFHPDCVVAEGPGQVTAKLIAGIRKSGSKVKIFTAVGSLVPPVLASIGKLADGVFAVNTTLLPSSSDPLVTKFRNDIFASMGQKAGAQNLNEFAQDGWSAVMLVNDALKSATDISTKSLIDALNKMNDVTVGNVKGGLDFTKNRDSKIYPRMFNTFVRYFTAKNGVYTDLDNQWHDVGQYIP